MVSAQGFISKRTDDTGTLTPCGHRLLVGEETVRMRMMMLEMGVIALNAGEGTGVQKGRIERMTGC